MVKNLCLRVSLVKSGAVASVAAKWPTGERPEDMRTGRTLTRIVLRSRLVLVAVVAALAAVPACCQVSVDVRKCLVGVTQF